MATMWVVPEYANDEKNTSSPTGLVLQVGGGMPRRFKSGAVRFGVESAVRV